MKNTKILFYLKKIIPYFLFTNMVALPFMFVFLLSELPTIRYKNYYKKIQVKIDTIIDNYSTDGGGWLNSSVHYKVQGDNGEVIKDVASYGRDELQKFNALTEIKDIYGFFIRESDTIEVWHNPKAKDYIVLGEDLSYYIIKAKKHIYIYIISILFGLTAIYLQIRFVKKRKRRLKGLLEKRKLRNNIK